MMSPGAESVEYTPSLAYSEELMCRWREQRGGSQLSRLPFTSVSGGIIWRERGEGRAGCVMCNIIVRKTKRVCVWGDRLEREREGRGGGGCTTKRESVCTCLCVCV